jgi:hypothetical protein
VSTLTTLIPAYRPDFLGDVFAGLRSQSCQDFRVLLADDSPGDEITERIRRGQWAELLRGLDVTVVRGPKDARRNHEHLLDLWAGRTPFAHFHLDDDIVYPDFYRAHLQAQHCHGIGLSVSQRWLGGADGCPAVSLPIPDAVRAQGERVQAIPMGLLDTTTLPACQNWLGELSNMVFSRDAASHFPRPSRQGLSFYGLMDIGFALEAAAHVPVSFIQDHLGLFRQHGGQTTQDTASHGIRVAHLCWVGYALTGWRRGRIDASAAVQAIAIAAGRCLCAYPGDPAMLRMLDVLEAHAHDLDALADGWSAHWLALLASDPSTRPQQDTAPAFGQSASIVACADAGGRRRPAVTQAGST